MCGRFVLISNLGQIAEEFDLTGVNSSTFPYGDIRPGQKTAGVIAENNNNQLLNLLWGFSPRWSKQAAASKLLINARAETLTEKQTFKEAFQRRRCLIPADGFYEWSKDKKQFYFFPQNRRPFGLAGIYEQNNSATQEEASFVIITTAPNKLIEPVHNRMPVIITADKQSLWLDNTRFEKSELEPLFSPYPEKEMEMRAGKYDSYNK